MNPELIDLHREWIYHSMTQLLISFAEEEVKLAQLAWIEGNLSNDPITEAQILGKAQAMHILVEYMKEGTFIEEVQNGPNNPRLSLAD